jgi:aspartyl-tRNA(Asn)/glutamyl-tRNA(Gln) amidotransferase subunit C
MATFNKETIRSLIQLSRIDCTEEEQERLLKDLEKIIHYFEQLEEINTDNIPPCNQVLEGMHNVMRDDVVGSTLPREEFLANAPSQIGGMIRIPPVIKST